MAREFVIEAELIAAIADFNHAAGVVQPLVRLSVAALRDARFSVDRLQGIGPESVLDVGRDQLLMLLFVMHSQFDAVVYLRGCTCGQQLRDTVFNVTAIGLNLLQRGPRKGSAQLFFGVTAEGFVITVKQPQEIGMKRLVARQLGSQDEGLEEPGGVRQVPFDRAGFGTGLNHHVFRGQGPRPAPLWCRAPLETGAARK